MSCKLFCPLARHASSVVLATTSPGSQEKRSTNAANGLAIFTPRSTGAYAPWPVGYPYAQLRAYGAAYRSSRFPVRILDDTGLPFARSPAFPSKPMWKPCEGRADRGRPAGGEEWAAAIRQEDLSRCVVHGRGAAACTPATQRPGSPACVRAATCRHSTLPTQAKLLDGRAEDDPPRRQRRSAKRSSCARERAAGVDRTQLAHRIPQTDQQAVASSHRPLPIGRGAVEPTPRLCSLHTSP